MDETEPDTENSRLTRGTDWELTADNFRSFWWDFLHMQELSPYLGFRVVRLTGGGV